MARLMPDGDGSEHSTINAHSLEMLFTIKSNVTHSPTYSIPPIFQEYRIWDRKPAVQPSNSFVFYIHSHMIHYSFTEILGNFY